MIKNLSVTAFFPLVTALLSPTTPIESRTLISLYIVHCSALSPSLSLLSINAYQKDLSDPNPLVRRGAIKTLSNMGLEDIRMLVGVAVGKGARDGSWIVRRESSDAIRVLWRSDPTHFNRANLLPTLVILLDNATALTLGAALEAWEEIFEGELERDKAWDLIHGKYRTWCRMFMDVEEWGQCVLLRVLVQYGRRYFLDPATRSDVDPDLELVLRGSEALLYSLNPAVSCLDTLIVQNTWTDEDPNIAQVVAGVVKLYYYLAPAARLSKIVRPLLRLLHGSSEVQAVALADCAIVAHEHPELLMSHLAEFFIRSDDLREMKQIRLEVLVALADATNVKVLLREFLVCRAFYYMWRCLALSNPRHSQHYVKDTDEALSALAISAIGTCAQRVPAVAEECLKTLVKLAETGSRECAF